MADPAASVAPSVDPLLGIIAGQGGSVALGAVALWELHRLRSAVDRLMERLHGLEVRFYGSVTQQRQSETER